MSKTADTQHRLTLALHAAREAAAEFANLPDEGTCNLDCAVFWPERGVRNAVIEAAAAAAGVRVHIRPWHGRCVFVYVSSGQGARNTAMAEAAEKVLHRSGLRSTVYYQID